MNLTESINQISLEEAEEKILVEQVCKNMIKNLDLRLEKKHTSFKSFNVLLTIRWYLVTEMHKFQ